MTKSEHAAVAEIVTVNDVAPEYEPKLAVSAEVGAAAET